MSAAEYWHAQPEYARARALESGALIDVSDTAAEAGFRIPVAVSAEAWADAVAWDPRNAVVQDEAGRLWDLLFIAALASRRAPHRRAARFTVLRVPDRVEAVTPELAEYVIRLERGAAGDPVLTIGCAPRR